MEVRIDMNSIKLIMLSIMLNLLIGMASIAGNVNQTNLNAFLTGYSTTINGYSDYVTDLKGSDSILSSSFGNFLSAVEGIINIMIFIVFFIGLFFSAIIAIPGALLAGGMTYLETFMGLAASFILVINNVVLIKEAYSIIINRKVEN